MKMFVMWLMILTLAACNTTSLAKMDQQAKALQSAAISTTNLVANASPSSEEDEELPTPTLKDTLSFALSVYALVKVF